MISWGTIAYGAALSAAAAMVLVGLARRDWRPSVLVSAALGAGGGAAAWNAILHDARGQEFFVDAPVAILPASWQDAGSGVFAVAVATVILGFGTLGRESGKRLAFAASLCGLASFLVDVYLY